MRLINAKTLELEEFIGENIPPYFILSHRWADEEITFKDFVKGRRRDALGHRKIIDCCEFVLRHHDIAESSGEDVKRYVWIDTVCIDKKSSADLSEAINSMFSYYKDAGVCVAYLADVEGSSPEQFANSSWFTRGWTLQELLAPEFVIFLDRKWHVIGRKGFASSLFSRNSGHRSFYCKNYGKAPALDDNISKITGIDTEYLHHPSDIQSATIARRMSWAANRRTLRVEDRAYSLLGLFDVNMPLLYGEGDKAFIRLQEEVLRKSNDRSIFAWWPTEADLEGTEFNNGWRTRQLNRKLFRTGILALSPTQFEHCGDIEHDIYYDAFGESRGRARPYAMTNLGLELHEEVKRVRLRRMGGDLFAMQLNCVRRGRMALSRVQILLCHILPVGRDCNEITGDLSRMEMHSTYWRVVSADEGSFDDAVVSVADEAGHEASFARRLMYVTPVDGLCELPPIHRLDNTQHGRGHGTGSTWGG